MTQRSASSNNHSHDSPGRDWLPAIYPLAALMLLVWFNHADWRLPATLAQSRPADTVTPTQLAQPTGRGNVPRDNDARVAIGLSQLHRQLRADLPTGRGVVVGHVEGNQGDYYPAINTGPYNGVEFDPRSGPSVINAHADSTARIIYGRTALAPGVKKVNLYSSYHWLRSGYLNTGSSDPPIKDDSRLFTHSWVGGGTDAFTRQALRRIDWAIDTHRVVMVVGVNNGQNSRVPALLCSAYNTIAVGNWVGDSSGRYTMIDGAGRCKPDIVGPNNQTSYATPTVAAMVARLLEAADGIADADADRPQVIKAVLMAGAVKPPGWRVEAGKPLDDHFGAGRLHVDHAYDILTAPPVQPGSIRQRLGWDYGQVESQQQHDYRFEVTQRMGEISIVLTWHRRIDGRVLDDLLTGKTRWVDTARLADLDLKLVRIDEAGRSSVLHESVSKIDNVEHIYLPHLRPGRYCIQVQRSDAMAELWDYALAWRLEEARP